MLPDLPKVNYNIWVRGYGLVDSPKVKSAPGKILNLKAVVAPNDSRGGADLSGDSLVLDDEDSGQERVWRRREHPPTKLTQDEYLNQMKSNGCANCHAIGTRATRTFPQNVPFPMGKFANSEEAWFRRIQSGQGGVPMFARMTKDLGAIPIKYLADWTRPHRQGRVAPYETDKAAGGRAQHRRDDLGLAR